MSLSYSASNFPHEGPLASGRKLGFEDIDRRRRGRAGGDGETTGPRARCPTNLRDKRARKSERAKAKDQHEKRGHDEKGEMREDSPADVTWRTEKRRSLTSNEEERPRRGRETRRNAQVLPAENFRCSGQSHFCETKKRYQLQSSVAVVETSNEPCARASQSSGKPSSCRLEVSY